MCTVHFPFSGRAFFFFSFRALVQQRYRYYFLFFFFFHSHTHTVIIYLLPRLSIVSRLGGRRDVIPVRGYTPSEISGLGTRPFWPPWKYIVYAFAVIFLSTADNREKYCRIAAAVLHHNATITLYNIIMLSVYIAFHQVSTGKNDRNRIRYFPRARHPRGFTARVPTRFSPHSTRQREPAACSRTILCRSPSSVTFFVSHERSVASFTANGVSKIIAERPRLI